MGVGDLGDLSYSSLPPWASISPDVNRSFPSGSWAAMRVEEKPLHRRKLVGHTASEERGFGG